MDIKTRHLLEDERARHDGRYYDAGLWLGLNWVLEEAQAEAERANVPVLDAVGSKKEAVLEDFKKAKEALASRKEKRIGINFCTEEKVFMFETNAWPADDGKASILAGELEGLEKAIEILKEACRLSAGNCKEDDDEN